MGEEEEEENVDEEEELCLYKRAHAVRLTRGAVCNERSKSPQCCDSSNSFRCGVQPVAPARVRILAAARRGTNSATEKTASARGHLPQ